MANWKTSAPIYAAMLAPILVLAVYAKMVIEDAWSAASDGQRMAATIAQATEASALAHELQKERGMSAGFVGSKGAQFGSQLASQRLKTDEVLKGVRAEVLSLKSANADGPELKARVETRAAALARFFDNLALKRQQIDRQQITVPALASAYTGAIRQLLSIADDPMLTGLQDRMARLNTVYGDVLMAKEFAGVERAMGSVGFGAGAFSTSVYVRFSNLQSRQEYLLGRAKVFAEPEHLAALKAAVESPAARRLKELRTLATQSLADGDLKGVTGPEWFAASTAWLGELAKVSGQLSTDIRAEAQASADAASVNVWIYTALSVLVVGLCLFFGLRYVNSMIMAMRGVRDAIVRIARREDGVEVPGDQRTDEIGEIARELSKIRSQGATTARIAAAITQAQTALLVTDAQHRHVFDNPAFEAVRAAAGSDFERLVIEAPDGARNYERLFQAVADARAGGSFLTKAGGDEAVEFEVGQARIEARITEVTDEAGDVIGTVTELLDVTVVRKLEAEVVAVIEDVRSGVFEKRVESIDHHGFTSFVAAGLNDLMQNVQSFMSGLNETLSAMGDGDLSRPMDGDFKGEFETARAHTNEALGRLRDAMIEIAEVAVAVESSAQPIDDGSQELARRAESQASTLEETAATMEEMTATINTNAENAQQSSVFAAEASENAEKGAAIVTDAVGAMARIETGSSRISEIITVIESIAFQTNLLALNAAVEAARAGDAGRGFAVVASEVRSLAQRSSEAAKDITQLIQESTSQVGDGVRLVRAAGGSLDDIVSGVRRLASTVQDISAASRDQSSGVAEITNAIGQMDGMTQQNAAMAQQSAAAARTLAEQAARLRTLTAQFTLDVEAAARRAA